MAKLTIEMNDKLNSTLDELAKKEQIPKAQVLRRSLTLLKLLEDHKDEGYKLALTKEGSVTREIVTS